MVDLPIVGEEKHFSFQFQLTFTDVLHAYRLYRAYTDPISYDTFNFFRATSLPIIGILIYLGISLKNQPVIFSNTLIWLLIALPVCSLFVFFDFPYSFVFWLTKDRYLQPRTLIVTHEDIKVEMQNIATKLEWGYFRGVIEGNREFILLHDRTFITIPKRLFEGDELIDQFRDLLKQKLPKFSQKLKIFMDFPN